LIEILPEHLQKLREHVTINLLIARPKYRLPERSASIFDLSRALVVIIDGFAVLKRTMIFILKSS